MQCPKCGEPLAAEDRYCEACGFRVSPAAATDEPAVAAAPTPLAVLSDTGRHHRAHGDTNQDAGAVGHTADGLVFLVVADGVSASANAEGASATAVAALEQALAAASEETLGERLRRAVAIANDAVLALPDPAEPGRDPPETTIVAALVGGRAASIAWAGDSRAYRLSHGGAEQLTQDDSWMAAAVAAGELTAEEARHDSRSHAITQCLGMRDMAAEIHLREVELAVGDHLLLCSDGLWNYFDDPGPLAAAVAQAPADADAAALCRHLVQAANDAGGHDNITVAVLRLE